MGAYMWNTKLTHKEQVSPTQDNFSVTEALQLAKSSLEALSLTVVGEVSEFNDKPGYKAAYFTITDKKSSLSCVMWKNKYHASGVSLKAGMLVELQGRFSVYPSRGSMQFDVSHIREAGEGDLRQKVAELARKLQLEGLMDPHRKKKPQAFCSRIALITSPRGKAVHDVLRTLNRRNKLVEVKFFGVPVEGKLAAPAMKEALMQADSLGVDAILLVRGGGSYEDLMPFNDEVLARTLAACVTPVVTGIGHEPDNSICDMVASLRCSTPTAAAESIAPSSEDLIQELDASLYHMAKSLKTKLELSKLRLERYQGHPFFKEPSRLTSSAVQQLFLSEDRLRQALPQTLKSMQQSYDQQVARMISLRVQWANIRKHQLEGLAGRLEALSPLSVLSRGYSMVQDNSGRLVSSLTQIHEEDELLVSLKDGKFYTKVISIDSCRQGKKGEDGISSSR